VQVRSSGKERLIRVTIEVNPEMEAWARAVLHKAVGPEGCRIG